MGPITPSQSPCKLKIFQNLWAKIFTIAVIKQLLMNLQDHVIQSAANFYEIGPLPLALILFY